MKAHFTQLFDYDRFANQLMLDTILTANNTGKAVQLMAHLLSAQQVWLNRCKNIPAGIITLWPDWPADQLSSMIDNNHEEYINYLNAQNEDDFNKVIAYSNTKGVMYENKLSNILTHLINHGTHHRAQAGQQLKFDGVETLPITDFIFYTRDI